MTRVVASAPGKVILSGEYAVLAGAPALAMAVDRRAVTTVEPSPEAVSVLETPGLAGGRWRFRSTPSREVEWLDAVPPRGAPLVDAAFGAVDDDVPPLSIRIDTRAFHDPASGRKLGLGSSAAAMTSLAAALGALDGAIRGGSRIAKIAHRRMQGGGSGVDVATSTHGGVIEYRPRDKAASVPRTWPPGLVMRVLWSGAPANTAAMIRHLDDRSWRTASGEVLMAAASAAADSWAAGGVDGILSSLGEYAEALRRFGIDQGLGIFDAGHDALFELARSPDVVYKPCGAGGGDVGIVLAADESRIRDFVEAATARGFSALGLSLDPSGADVAKT